MYIINTGNINSLNVKTNSKSQITDGVSQETELRDGPVEEEKKVRITKKTTLSQIKGKFHSQVSLNILQLLGARSKYLQTQ